MDDLKEKVKLAGWVAAATAFVALTLSNFGCPYMVQLAAWSLLVAGAALFWGERVKSSIVIALAGLLFLFATGRHDFIGRMLISILLYAGVDFYFKPTQLNKVTHASAWKLFVLSFIAIGANGVGPRFFFMLIMTLIAVFHFVYAACFISRRFLPLEEFILKYEDKVLGGFLFKLVKGFLGDIPRKVLSACSSAEKFCKTYAFSVFVLGLISAAMFVFWASPEKGSRDWDPNLVTMAVSQVIVCALWGCFILSQIACAIKLRGRQIVAGSAPIHLLIVSFLCWVLIVAVIIGVVYLFVEDPSERRMSSDWCLSLTLTLIDLPTLLGVAQRCDPKLAITLCSIVTIWHLLGSSFVALLIRNNIAKVRSLEDESAPAADHEA